MGQTNDNTSADNVSIKGIEKEDEKSTTTISFGQKKTDSQNKCLSLHPK